MVVDGDDDGDKLRRRRLGVDGDEGIRRELPGRTLGSPRGWDDRPSGIDGSSTGKPGVIEPEGLGPWNARSASGCRVDRGIIFDCSKSSFVLVSARSSRPHVVGVRVCRFQEFSKVCISYLWLSCLSLFLLQSHVEPNMNTSYFNKFILQPVCYNQLHACRLMNSVDRGSS